MPEEMPKENNRIDVIGAGRHARANILPSLALCGAQVESVTTRSLSHSRGAAREFGFPARPYADVGEMLAQETGEKAVVVLQAADAVPAVLRCLAAGRQVFVEKPCGICEADAQRIYEASLRCGRGVSVGFMKRYAPVYRKMKELLDGGSLGEVRSFRGSFCVDACRFCANDRDFVFYVAIHTLDLVRFLFGEAESVRAVKNAGGDGCSYAAAVAMRGGAVGTLSFENRTAWTRESESVCVTCSGGFLASDELTRLTVHESRGEDAPWQTLSEADRVYSDCFNPASGTEKDLYLRGFAGEMRDFAENGAQVSDDNLRTTRLCEDFLASLA